MPATESSFSFDPRTPETLPELLSECDCELIEADSRHIRIALSGTLPLSQPMLGRLLVINARCRTEDVRLEVAPSPTIHEQLTYLHIDRLLWIDA